MQRKDFYLLGILWVCVLFIFLPLFTSDYIFTDEASQIWGYNAIPGLNLFIDDGRWLTEILQSWLFKMADTIHDVTYLRLISLFGWLLCLPIWYVVIKKIIAKVPAYEYLPFFICLYLVTSLPFIASVQWATCMQFFIADTASLLAGAVVLKGIHFGKKWVVVSPLAVVMALLLGVAALFLYQGAFACFLIPFLLHFINPFNDKKDSVLISGLVVYFVVYVVYFVLYKVSFSLFNNIVPSPRNALYIDPWNKIKFFLARPLERSFRFTLITSEDSLISKISYPVLLGTLAVSTYIRYGRAKWLYAVKHLTAIGVIFVLSYLPPLLIQENYASNRTLMALNMCVFIVCFEMALYFIRSRRLLQIAGVAVLLFFVGCARYNFQQVFLKPVKAETAALTTFIKQHYHPGIQTIHFIRPSEDFMAEKYQVNRSMDEFGVPTSCMSWVPEPLVKQLVYETTGNRQQALQLVVKQWASKEEYTRSGENINSSILLVDVPAIMNAITP